ncbi:hypothetical protein AVEN_202697-1 [Araneus ventricosus]|uniref:Reverse transcriptase domain-containing protein n=1 Tax=Araneus ventricosus TaxID=182803 RepID=A0A4Y2U502_ARAVE|nr:hypothetical protein AVEN_202697-1 [Araneus ventricosus]
MADEILSVKWPQEVHLQAFADDLLTDNTREVLRKLSKFALDKFKDRADKNKLHVSMEKSSYVLFSILSEDQRLNGETNQLTAKTFKISRHYNRS